MAAAAGSASAAAKGVVGALASAAEGARVEVTRRLQEARDARSRTSGRLQEETATATTPRLLRRRRWRPRSTPTGRPERFAGC